MGGVTETALLSVPAVGERSIREDDSLGNWVNESNTLGMRLNMNISLHASYLQVMK
jgi:hypothetical protein